MPENSHSATGHVMKLITLLLGTFVLGLVAGIFVEDWSSPFKQTQLVRAFPAGGVYNRDFGSDDCVAPTFDENQVYESALGAIEIASQVLTRSRFVSGAKSLMATGFFRDLEDQRSVKVCPPADLYTRLKPVIEDSLYRYFMQYEQLSLASKMPDPRPELVRAVASIAFSQKPHLESDDVAFAGEDLRPFARWVLASMHPVDNQYLSTARELINGDDSLGTGAAQVAASYRVPDVLAKVETLMSGLIKDSASADGIDVESRDRLYELGYALALAGKDASNYTGPLHTLMSGKVGSYSKYGILYISPKRMCGVLRAIDGEDAIKPYEYCIDSNSPYAQ